MKKVMLAMATWLLVFCANSQVNLPWKQGFESATDSSYRTGTTNILGIPNTEFITATSGRMRTAAGTGFSHAGNRAITLDRDPNGTFVQNYFIQTLDLSSYTGAARIDFSFWWTDHGEEVHSGDRVWVRGSSTDSWIVIYNQSSRFSSNSNGNWVYSGEIDIVQELANNSQTVSSTTQIRFGQYDNYPASSVTGSDGFSFDDLELVEVKTNDGGIVDMNPICAGLSAVEVGLRNFGADTIRSAVIDWNINGTAQTTARLTGLLIPPGRTQSVTLGNYNVTLGTPYNLDAYPDSINGVPDEQAGNDTLSITFQAAYSGTFTVGRTGDFPMLQDAIDDLEQFGLCGAVTLQMLDTIFTEDVTIENIPGRSMTNTLRITSAPANQDPAVLDGTLELKGVAYLRLDHIEIYDATKAIQFNDHNHDIEIDSNYLHIDPTGSSSNNVIRDERSGKAERVNIHHNTIQGGYYGVYFRGNGTSRANRDVEINVNYNTIIGFRQVGVYFDELLDANIEYNVIRNDSAQWTPRAIDTRECNNMSISYNDILMFADGGGTGIYAYNNNRYGRQTSDTTRINGNSVAAVNDDATSTEYGIYSYYGYNMQIEHNTVHVSSTSGSSYALYTSTIRDSYIRNNVLENLQGSATWRHRSTYSNTSNDYNTFWAGVPGVDGTTNVTIGSNSNVAYPRFRDLANGDLRPNSVGLDSNALISHNITTDLLGQTKSATHPDRGAYEFDICKHDAGVRMVQHGYGMVPAGQGVPLFATVASIGLDTVSQATIHYSLNGATTSENLGVLRIDQDTVSQGALLVGNAVGTFQVMARSTIAEQDCGTDNDTAYNDVLVTDTVMARENATAPDAGIGNTTPIRFGQTIDVFNADTLSSLSFFLQNPTIGTSVRCLLYTTDAQGAPDQLLDSTRAMVVLNSQAGWYHMQMGCNGRVLQPGKYFIAMDQINPVNMTLGYIEERNTPDRFLYVDLLQGAGWVRSDDASLNSLVDNITLMLRANFGRWGGPDVMPASTDVCHGYGTYIKPTQNFPFQQWATGSIQDSILITTPGTYRVDVWDEIGCHYFDSTVATLTAPISVLSTPTAATCGLSDGSINVQATGGTSGPFQYKWSDGSTGATVSQLKAGDYRVTATDTNGCYQIDDVQLLGAFPEITSNWTYPSCNGDANGTAAVQVQSGVKPYTYAWSAGNTPGSPNNSGLAAGQYLVSVTDASNCTTIDTVDVLDPTIIITQPNGNDPSACTLSDGSAEINVQGGIPPYQYNWSDPNQQTTSKAIGLEKGIYDVTVIDHVGCVKTAKVKLVDPNSPVAVALDKSLDCSYDTTTVAVTINGGTGPFNYSWNYQNMQTPQIHGVGKGQYKLHLVDQLGCTFDTTVVISTPDPVQVQFSQPQYLGQGNIEVTATASGGTAPYQSYTWSNGETGQTASTLSNGVSTVTVVDDNGCSFDFQIDLYDPSTGFADMINNKQLSIYPNPTQQWVTLDFDLPATQTVSVRVLSSLGKTLEFNTFSEVSAEKITLDLGKYSVGVYYLDIQVGNERVTSRVQVTR
ncbi:T9SS type A sorting domain-containing protein [bacterium SCSIO 12741]|nr:T9SS type A sorting domain-containing protein [bacterium SCSIO 12741]